MPLSPFICHRIACVVPVHSVTLCHVCVRFQLAVALPLLYLTPIPLNLLSHTNLPYVPLMESEKNLPDPPAYRLGDVSPIASDVWADATSEQPMRFPEPHIDMPFPSTPVRVPSPARQKPNMLHSNTSTTFAPGPNTQTVGTNGALGHTAHSSNSSGTSRTEAVLLIREHGSVL